LLDWAIVAGVSTTPLLINEIVKELMYTQNRREIQQEER